ncbi:helix-turn-helix domain-containing protein [Acuticoccus sediminis]|uniref:helix-turn-helix domain-containing protein n=1 Tax=Acuticoccus sediminis TaxID=2184697 RepID=UPI00192E36F5|nr:AraC family transcriptional regulator [Acuticoccus sediminis]
MLQEPLVITDGKAVATRLVAHAEASLERDLGQVRACLRQLASLLAEDVGTVSPSGDAVESGGTTRGGLAPWQIRRVAAYVEANLGQSVSIADLAGTVRLSNGHFCRAFKASVGMTPHTFIVRRRVEHAQVLMLTTADTLSHIAAACGLTDQAHLTRLFRRYVGVTPLTWRRTWRRTTGDRDACDQTLRLPA